MCSHLVADLSPSAVLSCLALATTAQATVFTAGRVYELRTTADVWVRPGGGLPSASDQRVRPDSPLVFRADVGSASLLAATGADAVVTIRPMSVVDGARASCSGGCCAR